MTDGVAIRAATRGDVPVILELIQGLAEYEKLAHECVATEAALEETLFGARPQGEVIIALADGTPAGFALFFHNYSTFLARHGIFLEDLFVKPRSGGAGSGKPSSPTSLGSPLSAGAAASSGVCSTGTPTRSSSTSHWGPGRWMSGPCIGSLGRPSRNWQVSGKR